MSRGFVTREDEEIERITNYLSGIRKNRNYTQSDVAFNAGIDRTTYSRMEKNRQKMTLKAFIAACNTIGIEPSELLKGVGK